MTRYRLIRAVAMAGLMALSAAAFESNSGETAGSGGMDARGAAPPVLRNADPGDTRIVRLPGPPRTEAVPAAPAPAPAPAPMPPASAAVAPPAPTPVPETPAPRLPKSPSNAAMTASTTAPARRTAAAIPNPPPIAPPPAVQPAPRRKIALPPDYERDSAEFCRQRIAAWTEADARALLGEPRRSRPAFGPDNSENGRILAFADPSGRHHQLELDFDRATGRLRTVFVYPWDMTWDDCQRLWGDQVLPAKSNKGRTFYSYADRRLDVLVDAEGKVVSLGLY